MLHIHQEVVLQVPVVLAAGAVIAGDRPHDATAADRIQVAVDGGRDRCVRQQRGDRGHDQHRDQRSDPDAPQHDGEQRRLADGREQREPRDRQRKRDHHQGGRNRDPSRDAWSRAAVHRGDANREKQQGRVRDPQRADEGGHRPAHEDVLRNRDEEVLRQAGWALICESEEARVRVHAPPQPRARRDEEQLVDAEDRDDGARAHAQQNHGQPVAIVGRQDRAADEVQDRDDDERPETNQALRQRCVRAEHGRRNQEVDAGDGRKRDRDAIDRCEWPEAPAGAFVAHDPDRDHGQQEKEHLLPALHESHEQGRRAETEQRHDHDVVHRESRDQQSESDERPAPRQPESCRNRDQKSECDRRADVGSHRSGQ